MIIISSAVQQDKIIETLEQYSESGLTFEFKEKKGIKLYFETNAQDLEGTVRIVKDTLKAQPWGSVLYFQVEAN